MHLKMDDPHRVLHVAFGLSLLVHAVALSIHFKVPETLRAQLSNQPLEVVLVNAKTKEGRPHRAPWRRPISTAAATSTSAAAHAPRCR